MVSLQAAWIGAHRLCHRHGARRACFIIMGFAQFGYAFKGFYTPVAVSSLVVAVAVSC